jgi:hypothetical protein
VTDVIWAVPGHAKILAARQDFASQWLDVNYIHTILPVKIRILKRTPEPHVQNAPPKAKTSNKRGKNQQKNWPGRL